VGYEIGSAIGILYTVLGFIVGCSVIYLYFYLKSRAIHYEITTQRIKL
jgi:tetrahydromethanopterin S-methyltransferase subunit G